MRCFLLTAARDRIQCTGHEVAELVGTDAGLQMTQYEQVAGMVEGDALQLVRDELVLPEYDRVTLTWRRCRDVLA